MNEPEKFEAQGKVYAALKQGKTKVATISGELSDYGRSLEEVSGLISRFLSEPEYRQNYVLVSTHLKQVMESLETERMLRLVDEFTAESVQLRELQQQVDQF